MNIETIDKSILPMMDKLVGDDIPNIRFNVAKSYGELINVLKRLPEEGTIYTIEKAGGNPPAPSPKGDDIIQTRILPNLEKLKTDDDVDVRFFATTAAGRYDSDAMQITN